MKKISILIPCYNEELNVEPMAHALTEMFAKDLPNYDYEIVFMDSLIHLITECSRQQVTVLYPWYVISRIRSSSSLSM